MFIMKKALAIICVLFMFIFVSCNKHNKDPDENLSVNNSETSTYDFLTSEPAKQTVTTSNEVSQPPKPNFSSVSPSLTEKLEKVPPYILTESLKDLKLINTAVNSMSETEFEDYMKTNFSAEAFNGMDSIENTQKYLSDFESAYVVYVDEFPEDNTMAYYTEYGDISYKIPVDNNVVMTFTYYLNSENAFEYKEMDYIRYLKTYEINEISIELFENESDETDGFYGNIKYKDVCIPFFTNTKINVEDFEEILSQLKIVQLGSLLNE